MRRARSMTVLLLLALGALLLIASTQTWFSVVLLESPDTPLAVTGSDAIPVLAPLALAALALALAMSIAGRFLSYATALLAVGIGVFLVLSIWDAATGQTAAAISSSVTEATGIAGADSIDALVRRVETTPWPLIALLLSCLVLAIGIFATATAHTWRRTGRRYRTDSDGSSRTTTSDAEGTGPDAQAEPLDAIDSWDDLSHGSDPTR